MGNAGRGGIGNEEKKKISTCMIRKKYNRPVTKTGRAGG